MKRLHVVLIGGAVLALLSLSVTVSEATDEATWGAVKSLARPQPAAKMLRLQITDHEEMVALMPDWYDKNANEDVSIIRDWEVHFDVTGQLVGTAVVYAHYQMNWRGIAQESFLVRFDVTIQGTGIEGLDGLHGIFEGQATGKYNAATEIEAIRFRLHGSGEAHGLMLEYAGQGAYVGDFTYDLMVPDRFFNKAE